MTNRGIQGPSTPGTRFAGLGDLSSATYGSEPVWNPATNSYVLQQGSKYNPAASTYNVSDSSLRRWKASLARALTSTSVATIVCLGDSITQGTTSTPNRSFNWPNRLRSLLLADGRCGLVGEGASFNTGATQANYDERWTLGASWGWQSGGLLNHSMAQSAPGGGNLSFVLPTTADTVTIYYVRHSINGTWTWNINGGATTGVNANGATAVLSTTFTITPGVNTLNITPHATTGYAMVIGVRWSIAATPNDVEVFTGGGYSGQTSSFLVSSSGFGNLETIDILKPDLTIVCMGRNDAAGGVNMGTYRANMQQMIDRCRITNNTDIMLLTPPPALASAYPLDAQMRDVLYSLALSNDVALIDLANRFGPNWYLAPYLMSGDNLHPNDAGQQQLAQCVANVLLNV